MVFHRLGTRGILIALGLIALSPFAVLVYPQARAAFRLTSGFRSLETEPRVFYEKGAETHALRFAVSLPGAISKVEEAHSLPFKYPFRVYVCSTHESFCRHVGEAVDSPVRGIALYRDVWVSPMAFSFEGLDTHRQTLVHELSHLHISQYLGVWGSVSNVPTWFREGLADWVADTGGEMVSRQQALHALASGRRLMPDAVGRLLVPRRAPEYGLSWPMFHQQSRLFVEYLHERDERSFERFLVALLEEAHFDVAFTTHFGVDLDGLWGQFLKSVKGGSSE